MHVLGRRGLDCAEGVPASRLFGQPPHRNQQSDLTFLQISNSHIGFNDMTVHVSKAEERADIIRFLRVSSGL